jgi:hypothetical protein
MRELSGYPTRAMTLELANAPQDRIGEMSVRKIKFVVVNNMAPRNPSVCAACSRPLERGYLHDLSTSKRDGCLDRPCHADCDHFGRHAVTHREAGVEPARSNIEYHSGFDTEFGVNFGVGR